MKKIIKYISLGIAAIFLVIAAAAGYLIATFDPNSYKPQIITAVKNSTQRDLKLDGNISLMFYPSIGVRTGKVSLSEFRNQQEFLAIDDVHVSLALLPLLAKKIVVENVEIRGLKVQLIKHKDGKLNIDDLTSGGTTEPAPAQAQPTPAAGSPILFDVASINLNKTNLSYLDESNGATYEINDLNLRTGRIANNHPVDVELEVALKGTQPKLDIATRLKTRITFDLDKKIFQIAGLDLQTKGSALDITNLTINASGEASANPESQEFSLKNFTLSSSGSQGSNSFEAKLAAPSLTLSKDKISGDKLSLDAAQSQLTQNFKAKIGTSVTGSLDTQQFNLPDLSIALNATGEQLPSKSVSSELKGSVRLDAKKQSVAIQLAGGLLQSQVKADVAVNNFSKPAIRFNIAVDQFDADLYLPKKAAGSSAPAAKQSTAAEQPFDLSALRDLDLDGKLSLGAVKAFNAKASKLQIGVNARKGLVKVDPLAVNLYQGNLKGSITVNATPAIPTFALNVGLNSVEINPLAKDAADLDIVEGKGNVNLNLNTQGNLVSTLKKKLNGNMSVNLNNGAIKGIDLAKLVQSVQSLSKDSKLQTFGVNKDEKTVFSELKASFKVNNGVAHNDDLSVKAPTLHITGNGDIDIGNDSMNYTAKATFSKTEGGGTGALPVYLSGTFTELKYKVDFGALLADVAKQKLGAKVEEAKTKAKEDIKSKAQDELKKGLKGLFQ